MHRAVIVHCGLKVYFPTKKTVANTLMSNKKNGEQMSLLWHILISVKRFCDNWILNLFRHEIDIPRPDSDKPVTDIKFEGSYTTVHGEHFLSLILKFKTRWLHFKTYSRIGASKNMNSNRGTVTAAPTELSVRVRARLKSQRIRNIVRYEWDVMVTPIVHLKFLTIGETDNVGTIGKFSFCSKLTYIFSRR